MARPSKYTAEIAAKILAALRAGSTDRGATAYAGIDETTFYRWQNRNASFASASTRARADAEMSAVVAIRQAMTGGQLLSRITTIAKDGSRTVRETFSAPDPQAAEWWLERRHPKEWGRIDRIELELKETLADLSAELDLDKDALLAEAERLVRGDQ
jgi:hypothetical protein